MKQRKNCIIFIGVASVLLSFWKAAAQPWPCMTGETDNAVKGKHPRRLLIEELNLTVEQKKQLMALREEMKPVRQKHMESVIAVREKIKAELLKTDPSEDTLYGYAVELGELHKQMAKERADHLLKVKKILTPEQFSKLVEKEDKPHCTGYEKFHRKMRRPHMQHERRPENGEKTESED